MLVDPQKYFHVVSFFFHWAEQVNEIEAKKRNKMKITEPRKKTTKSRLTITEKFMLQKCLEINYGKS